MINQPFANETVNFLAGILRRVRGELVTERLNGFNEGHVLPYMGFKARVFFFIQPSLFSFEVILYVSDQFRESGLNAFGFKNITIKDLSEGSKTTLQLAMVMIQSLHAELPMFFILRYARHGFFPLYHQVLRCRY